MKHIIILGDGMADWPVKALGGKTLLQALQLPIWTSWHAWDVWEGW